VAPGMVLGYMVLRRPILQEKRMAAKFGFFYFGYKEKYFYWFEANL